MFYISLVSDLCMSIESRADALSDRNILFEASVRARSTGRCKQDG